MKSYEVMIEVEADRTCTVRVGHNQMHPWGPKITGLSPEQATHTKKAMEIAFATGWTRGLNKATETIELLSRQAPE